ncbi:flavin dependent monooxygenase-like protein [Stipitochalara longipes BDJ]|nr:flavin dependent monooxygenase-like protein [Stipitochalara longipes BDJ]
MGSLPLQSGSLHVKRVAIIGAGPSGLAVAKYLLAENAFDKIDVYEQQAEVGGVWNYNSNITNSTPIPQTSPNVPLDEPVWPPGAAAPLFPNPMYDRLITNIPKQLMQYSDQAFLSESLLFPSREDVQDYLIRYSQDVRHLIMFSTQVEDVSLSQDDDQDRWHLTARSTTTSKLMKNEYDAVVVANGHYSVPFIPSVPGIEEFQANHPSIISHSKNYRSPKSFENKKVIVVGGGASGLDIGNQISVVCAKPLLNSIRSEEPLKLGKEVKEEVLPIAEYLVEERGVRFEDGRIEKDVDAILYCTGYLYAYPFLRSLDPPIVTTGRRVIGLYKQMFHTSHPTLAFTALSQKVIPFPLSEGQAAVIAKVWSNKLFLPEESAMKAWEKEKLEELGDTRNFHILGFPRDADYINELHDWAGRAENGFAKEPPRWDEQQRHTRSIFVDIRKRFVELGGKVTSMKELGPGFEALDRQ